MLSSDARNRGKDFNPEEILDKMRKDYWDGLARPSKDEGGTMVLMLTFEVENRLFAVDVLGIREIIKVPPWISRVPRSPVHLLGIVNLRGQILPVIDIRRSSRSRSIDKGRIVVFKGETQDVGLYTDRVVGLPELDLADIQKSPSLEDPLLGEVIEGQIQVTDDEADKVRIADIINAKAFGACGNLAFLEGG
jgi:chemotaxis signal transduction protein